MGAVHRSFVGAGFSCLLAFPSGLFVLAAIFFRVPVELAIAVAVAPRIYFQASEVLRNRAASDWMLAARARGISRVRLLMRFLVPSAAGEIAALAGLAAVNALAITIPAEVLTGRPGVGQLAWQSATERDLPVVIAVTLVMLLIARAVTLASSLRPRYSGAAV
jgi:peptide/nickel transport system permease protein